MSTANPLRVDPAAWASSALRATSPSRLGGLDAASDGAPGSDPFSKALERSRDQARADEARQRSRIILPAPGFTPAPTAKAVPESEPHPLPSDGPVDHGDQPDKRAPGRLPPLPSEPDLPAEGPPRQSPTRAGQGGTPGSGPQGGTPGSGPQAGPTRSAQQPPPPKGPERLPPVEEGEAGDPVVCGPAMADEQGEQPPSATPPPGEPAALQGAASRTALRGEAPAGAALRQALHATGEDGLASTAEVQQAAARRGGPGFAGPDLGGASGLAAAQSATGGLQGGGSLGLDGATGRHPTTHAAAGGDTALAAAAPGTPAATLASASADPLARAPGPAGDLAAASGALLPGGDAAASTVASAATAAQPLPGSASTADTPQAQATLAARPGSPEFPQQLGLQLAVWVRNGLQSARLHLNPAELGPVRVEIQLDGTAAQVSMAAAHGETRQALQDALPGLAAALRDAGFTLTGGGISDQGRAFPSGAEDMGRGQGNAQRDAGLQGGPGMRGGADDAEPAGLAAAVGAGARRRGLVDLLA